MTGQPTRCYTRPPFERGNFAGQRHGAYSPRKVDPLAVELVRVVLDTGPDYLAEPSYAPAL